MHEANTALLDILVDNSVIIPAFQNRISTFLNNGLQLLFFTSYIAGILNTVMCTPTHPYKKKISRFVSSKPHNFRVFTKEISQLEQGKHLLDIQILHAVQWYCRQGMYHARKLMHVGVIAISDRVRMYQNQLTALYILHIHSVKPLHVGEITISDLVRMSSRELSLYTGRGHLFVWGGANIFRVV